MSMFAMVLAAGMTGLPFSHFLTAQESPSGFEECRSLAQSVRIGEDAKSAAMLVSPAELRAVCLNIRRHRGR
jgi:hypothetical protein